MVPDIDDYLLCPVPERENSARARFVFAADCGLVQRSRCVVLRAVVLRADTTHRLLLSHERGDCRLPSRFHGQT